MVNNKTKWILKYFLNFRKHICFLIKGNTIPLVTYIRHDVSIRKSSLGKYCYIGEYSSLNCVKMGNYCSIAPNVHIGGMEHSIWEISTSLLLSDSGKDNITTEIGNDVWIGSQCFIKSGVRIGNGAVIGANSLVNKDIPPFAIAFGSPAKIYKYRFSNEIISQIQSSLYWEQQPDKAKEIIKLLSIKG